MNRWVRKKKKKKTNLEYNDHFVFSLDNDGHVDANMEHGNRLVDNNIGNLGSVNEPRHAPASEVHRLDLYSHIPNHQYRLWCRIIIADGLAACLPRIDECQRPVIVK